MAKLKEHILYVDTYEPDAYVTYLSQSVPAEKANLNMLGLPDYYWIALKASTNGYSRKQLGEALSDVSAVEEQLSRDLKHCDNISLLTEGVGVPTPAGTQIYELTTSQEYFRKGFHHNFNQNTWSRWEAFKWSLWHEKGIQTVEVSTSQATIRHLAAAFKQSMKPEHTTLERYIVPHVAPRSQNQHIDNLLRLKGVDIGPKRAQTLIKEFGTFHGVTNAGYAKLVGMMGGAWTDKFFTTIGRK